jgi:hypothetical protein
MALGAYAALGHLALGPAPTVERAAGASLNAQSAQLDAMESDLRAALAENPPQLPGIPKYPPVDVPKVPKPRVVQVAYVTTTTTVVKKHHDKKYEKDKKESERAKHEAEKRRERAKHEAEKRREEAKKKREEEKKKEEEHD